MGEKKNVCKISVGKSRGMISLRILSRWWKGDIKIYQRNRVCGDGLDSSDSVQGPTVGFCGHYNEPSTSIKVENF